MFDARLRPIIDPPLNRMGAAIARTGISADMLTLASGAAGVLAGGFISQGWYGAGLLLILLSRLLDGLDGAVARATKTTDLGGYLDIVADFFFYVAVPIGFGFADPRNMPFALVLVGTFALTGVSFLAFATVAAKRGTETSAHGKKSFFYSTGIAEGAETIVVFILMCLQPSYFPIIAGIYAAVCLITVAQRSLMAMRLFADHQGGH